jgi:hypothetical protein
MELAKNCDDIIGQFGVSVELDAIDFSGTADAWEDPNIGYSTSTITALVQGPSYRDAWTVQGLLREGDMTAFVLSTQSVKIRDRIVLGGITYEVVAMDQKQNEGVNIYTKLALKKLLTG